jgi:carbonic anhydrase
VACQILCEDVGDKYTVKTVDIIYRYNADETAIRPLPSDSDAALLRLERGNKDFAALLDHVKDEIGIQQVITVDPRDLGLVSGNPKQRPYAAVLGCSDAPRTCRTHFQ